MKDEELTTLRVQVATLFELVDELIIALRKADPQICKQLVTSSKLNDFYLIRRGGK